MGLLTSSSLPNSSPCRPPSTRLWRPLGAAAPTSFRREALAFDDVTDELRQLHRLPITLEAEGAGVVLQSNDSESAGDFDFAALAEFLGHGRAVVERTFRRCRTGPRRLCAPLHAMEGARRSSGRLRPLAQPPRPLGLVGTRRSLRRPRQRTAAPWRRRGLDDLVRAESRARSHRRRRARVRRQPLRGLRRRSPPTSTSHQRSSKQPDAARSTPSRQLSCCRSAPARRNPAGSTPSAGGRLPP